MVTEASSQQHSSKQCLWDCLAGEVPRQTQKRGVPHPFPRFNIINCQPRKSVGLSLFARVFIGFGPPNSPTSWPGYDFKHVRKPYYLSNKVGLRAAPLQSHNMVAWGVRGRADGSLTENNGLKGPRGPFKGPRGPLKGPRGPFKGPRTPGSFKRTPGSF